MKTALKKVATANISSNKANHFSLSGTLNFDTVPTLMKQAERMLANESEATVDFSDVESANSAGLALLLEMLRFTRTRNALIKFEHVPQQITIVARAYGIDAALDSAEFVNQV